MRQCSALFLTDRAQVFSDCGVGSTQLIGVIPDTEGRGDRAVVEVRWSGKRVQLAPNNTFRVLAENYLEYSLFVLWRHPGAKTDTGKGISSAHCPGCGAPQSNSASPSCDFCGVVLNDTDRMDEVSRRHRQPRPTRARGKSCLRRCGIRGRGDRALTKR